MYQVIGQGVLVDVGILTAIDILATANTPCYTFVARLSSYWQPVRAGRQTSNFSKTESKTTVRKPGVGL